MREATPTITVYPMWVITENPSDFPNCFVVRQFDLVKLADGKIGHFPSPLHKIAVRLEDARRLIPPGMMCVPRYGHDDPVIVETWTDPIAAKWLIAAANDVDNTRS